MLTAFPHVFSHFDEVPRWLGRVVRRIAAAYWRSQHLRALRQVDDRLLADIGLTRSEVERAIRDIRCGREPAPPTCAGHGAVRASTISSEYQRNVRAS